MSELLGSMFENHTSRSPHPRGRVLCALAAGTVLALVGCGESLMEPTGESSLGPTQASPTMELPPLSAAMVATNTGGADNFHFLPPIALEPEFTGTFGAELDPVVEICVLDGDECGSTVARFTTTPGSGSETIRVDEDEDYYIVNWQSARGRGRADYRISVSESGNELGYADVTVKRGRTLPIKFWIGETEDEEPPPPPAPVCGDLSTAHWPADGTPEDVVGGCNGVWKDIDGNPVPDDPAMYGVGVAGQAFSFDPAVGVARVEVPFNRTGDFTLSLWAKTDERLQTGFTGVFASADGVGDPNVSNSLTFQVDLDGNGNYRVRVGQNTDLSLGSISTTGDFQHIAVTWDGTNVQTYLNGVFIRRSQLDFPLTIDLVKFGTNRGGGLHFDGLVDEVQIFDQALNGEEILAICNALSTACG